MVRNNRIDALRYYGIIGMCLLHSSYLLSGINTTFSPFAFISSCGGAFLPLYFFLSAFFFTLNFQPDMIEGKVTSRIKKCLFPYIFWNELAIVGYSILFFLQQTTGAIFTHETYFPNGLKENIRFVILGYRNPPLWYLKVLIEFVFFTPVIISLFKKSKKISFLTIITLFLFNLCFYNEIEYASVLHWMPMYMLGVWFGAYNPKYVLNDKGNKIISILSVAMLAILISVTYYLKITSNESLELVNYSGWMILPIILLELSHILPNKKFIEKLYDAEFFIFCCHYPLIQMLDATMDNIFIPVTNIELIIKWASVLVLAIIIMHLVHWFIKKYIKTLYQFLYGTY